MSAWLALLAREAPRVARSLLRQAEAAVLRALVTTRRSAVRNREAIERLSYLVGVLVLLYAAAQALTWLGPGSP